MLAVLDLLVLRNVQLDWRLASRARRELPLKELSRVRPKKSTASPLPPRWTFSSSNWFPDFENKWANDFSRLLLGLVQLLVVDVHQVDAGQRWANTIFWTEYEYKYYSESEFWPNTNTNNIRFSEWANTNTNNIRAQIFGRIRIRIIFGFRIVPEYEYE